MAVLDGITERVHQLRMNDDQSYMSFERISSSSDALFGQYLIVCKRVHARSRDFKALIFI